MIPKDLKHAEVGALLKAIGQQMFYRDLCFGAALEDGHSRAEIVEDLIGELDRMADGDHPNPRQRAHELLRLTGEEVISFNELFTLQPHRRPQPGDPDYLASIDG